MSQTANTPQGTRDARTVLVDSATHIAETNSQYGLLDPYHATNLHAALAMIKAGYGSARYSTQWASGTTLWITAEGVGATVTADGVVTINGQNLKGENK